MLDSCIIGIAKSGTSSLAAMLKKHSDISFSRIKEPHFFWPNATLYCGPADPSWTSHVPHKIYDYYQLFDKQTHKVKMEASGYISDPSSVSLANLYKENKKIKLIVILRDPIERAISAYRHLVRDGYENLSFHEAIAAEKKRYAMNWGPLYWYHRLSDYKPQIQNLLKIFPKKQVHFMLFEKLIENPGQELIAVENFLEISHKNLHMTHLNSGKVAKKHFIARKILDLMKSSRDVSRRIFSKEISSFLGKKALAFQNKWLTEKIKVAHQETTAFWNIYQDIPFIEDTTCLPCTKYWKKITDPLYEKG